MPNEITERHVFEIRPERIREFVTAANYGNGNTVERIDLHGEKYIVVIGRSVSYPFVINELRKFEQ